MELCNEPQHTANTPRTTEAFLFCATGRSGKSMGGGGDGRGPVYTKTKQVCGTLIWTEKEYFLAVKK